MKLDTDINLSQFKDETGIEELIRKIESLRYLLTRCRGEGSTTAAKKAIEVSRSPILLTGQQVQGRRILKDIDKNSVKVIGWSEIDLRSAKGQRGQIIVDNSFLISMSNMLYNVSRRMYERMEYLRKKKRKVKLDLQMTKGDLNTALNRIDELLNKNESLKDKLKKCKDQKTQSSK